jgi:hypothetical protein
LCGHLAAQGGRVDVVDEGALAVDLDDGQPFAVPRLELGIAADVDLAKLEAELVARLGNDRAGPLAEMTALRVVEDDSAGSKAFRGGSRRVDRSVQTAVQGNPARPDGRRRKRAP